MRLFLRIPSAQSKLRLMSKFWPKVALPWVSASPKRGFAGHRLDAWLYQQQLNSLPQWPWPPAHTGLPLSHRVWGHSRYHDKLPDWQLRQWTYFPTVLEAGRPRSRCPWVCPPEGSLLGLQMPVSSLVNLCVWMFLVSLSVQMSPS